MKIVVINKEDWDLMQSLESADFKFYQLKSGNFRHFTILREWTKKLYDADICFYKVKEGLKYIKNRYEHTAVNKIITEDVIQYDNPDYLELTAEIRQIYNYKLNEYGVDKKYFYNEYINICN